MRAFWGALALLAMGGGRALAEGPIALGVSACFTGMPRSGAIYPISVALRNVGPSVDGRVVVTVDSYGGARRYVYPCPLPSGSVKRVLAYPKVDRYSGDLTISYSGGPRGLSIPFYFRDANGRPVGVISDHVGGLNALAGARPMEEPFVDCYCKPEDAPDRSPAYNGLAALVIGDGAERLGDAQWAAIRRWALAGGRVILLGGAAGGWMNLPSAQALCPLSNVHGADVPRLAIPWLQGYLPDGPAAIQTGAAKPGAEVLAAQNGQPVLTARAIGAGMTLCVGFNPMEKRFRARDDQAGLWTALLEQSRSALPAAELRGSLQRSLAERQYGGGPAGAVNPFELTLPPAGTIAWMFLAYFLLVIPITYLTLKRLRRLEWAWITSPAISLAFVGALYLFTADLYKAGASHRTRAVVLADADNPDAVAIGATEAFFQRSGDYRIEAPHAENLELTGEEDEYGYGGRSARQPQPLVTVDAGTVVAPSYAVTNLSFRRFFYTQPIALSGAIRSRLTLRGDSLEGTLYNGSGYALANAEVYIPSNSFQATLGHIAAGQTVSERRRAVERPLQASALQRLLGYQRNRGSTTWPTYGLLIADVPAGRFGPALGRNVGGPDAVTLVVSVPVEVIR